MRGEEDIGVVQWIGLFISMLMMLMLSFRKKSAEPEDVEGMEMQEELQRRAKLERQRRELFDDEEEPRDRDDRIVNAPSQRQNLSTYEPYSGQSVVRSRSSHLQAHAKREQERALNANYRLKNALTGFQQRRPIDQKRPKNAIERRTMSTMQVSDFLRVDSDAEARLEARLQKQEQRNEEQLQVRHGVLWYELLAAPMALRKGSHFS